MSTFSRSATSAALRSGRTLKPMMMAFEAVASSTSDSLMAPTPEWMILISVFSSVSFDSVSASTSAEPCTSALMMIGSSFIAAFGHLLLQRFERQAAPLAPSAFSLACDWRKVAICRALAGSVTDWNESPGEGSDSRPSSLHRRRRTGLLDDAAAVVDQRAHAADDGAGDDVVADAQRAVLHEHGGHRAAAAIELGLEHGADGARFGLALCSSISVTSRIISSSVSRFCLLLGRDLDEHGVAAPVFRHQAEVGELALRPFPGWRRACRSC